MKIIKNGNVSVSKLIEKRDFDSENFFRLSDFAYMFSTEEHHLIQYTLTGMLVEFSDDEWSVINNLQDHQIKGYELDKSGLSELIRKRVIVESDTDEYQHYSLVVHVLKTMSNKNDGVKSYIILPTTACNARCIYCYEEGMPYHTMSIDTADNVVDFICRTRRSDEISIIWFGGEPLSARHVISHICRKLNEKNISFRSKVVTNATLLTKELVAEAKETWHLKSVQVSVDGNRHDYELRKNYYNPSLYNYTSMMNALSYLLDAGIKVSVRCNYDSGNLSGMKEFLEDIKIRFGNAQNLFIYFAMLFQEKNKKESVVLQKELINLIRHFHETGMKIIGFIDKDYRLKANCCMADSEGKSVVIEPNGYLYHCEHLPTNTPFGNIRDENVKISSDNRVNIEAHDKCRRCCFLPCCTPFFRNGCPDWFEYCYEFKCIEMDYMLERLILGKSVISSDEETDE